MGQKKRAIVRDKKGNDKEELSHHTNIYKGVRAL